MQGGGQPLLAKEGEVAFEGNHDVPVVWRNDARKDRYRTRNSGFGKEGEKANHRKAAVVNLLHEASFFSLWGHTREEVEGVVEIEYEFGTVAFDGWVVARDTALCVVNRE